MAKGICDYFEAGKKCRRGEKCIYKHEWPATSSSSSVRKQHHNSKARGSALVQTDGLVRTAFEKDEFADLRKRWLFCIPQETRKSRPLSGDELENFLEMTLKLVESSAENMQLVISKLGGELGLLRVRQIFDWNFDKMNDDKLDKYITTLLLPYFRILAHKAVMQSMVVETQHTALLNALYGINGARGANVFAALVRGLSAQNNSEEVETAIAVLAAMLDRNRSGLANPTLQAAAEFLISLLDLAHLSRASERHVRTIKTILQLAVDLPETRATVGRVDPHATVATFTFAQDLPGALSEHGPRHDNDSDNIQDIEILPTLQEIMSDRTEYLPREDPRYWHIPGLPGLLDRHFRLVREDTVGQLRDAVKAQLSRQQSAAGKPVASTSGIRTNAYDEVSLCDAVFDDRKGLLFALEFNQPQLRHGKSPKNRQEWWQESQRLGPESLICLLSSSEDGDQEAAFLVVHSPEFHSSKKKTRLPIHEQYTLWNDPDRAFVIARLASAEPDAASEFLKSCLSSGKVRRSLVEFPGVLLPAFGPTLAALQRMAGSLDVPFVEALVPHTDAADPQPPAYSVRGGFQYNLRGLIPEAQLERYHITGDAKQDINSALELSGLDESQRDAAQHAFTHAIGLIQGPPGTGKSYTGVKIIQALLDNKDAADLGPIICVCYTNHALDQLLEHLLDAGVTQIARIGSQSKSARLAGVNLRTLAAQQDRTHMESKKYGESRGSIEKSGEAINQLLQRLDRILQNDEKDITDFLQSKFPALHAQLPRSDDEDGFTVVSNKKSVSFLEAWLGGGENVGFSQYRSLSVLRSGTVRLRDMSHEERRLLHESWIEDLSSSIYYDLMIELSTFNRSNATLDSLRGDLDLRVLSEANVVGITTTGLARQLDTLSQLPSKVLVVEEAGEVLEAHLLTAMLPSLEHAILIGDHQQLRPKVQNYDLSVENPRSNQIALDISLFERLLHPRQEGVQGLPHVTLETQRRMHPSISQLIRSTLYPSLQDADSVNNHSEVLGMRKRLFWIDHQKKEDGQNEQLQSTSRTNRYEVDMVVALVGHLQKQGVYAADDIAVLTPYLGQLRLLRAKLKKSFDIILNDRDVNELAQDDATKDEVVADADDSSIRRPSVTKGTLLQAIRLATVDNFQGEEAKVVIVSLVRSNDSNNCGFLRTPNRINVLLSRAKHGMYMIGNSKTSSTVPMWHNVLEILRSHGNVGPSLELCCPRHPDTPMEVTEPEDFTRVAPEAGCDLMCGKQLPCGHACPTKCHAESLHNGVHCLKDCMRPRKGCKHPCKRVCGDHCEALCTFIVECDIALPCGHHVNEMPCWLYQDQAKYECTETVKRQVPDCGHEVVVACHVVVDATGFRCDQPYEIRDIVVDLYTMETYAELDLDKMPCLFPPCGHIFTIETLDGQMGMSLHYNMQEVNDMSAPVSIKGDLLPLSYENLKTCPNCRGSLRTVARYGRIIRRALLDESTKKFITWSNQAYVPLAQQAQQQQEELLKTAGQTPLTRGVSFNGPNTLPIAVRGATAGRYSVLLKLRRAIAKFTSKVRAEEQPFQRVRDLVESVRRHQSTDMPEFEYDQSILQTRGLLLAMGLGLRCDLVIITDLMRNWEGMSIQQRSGKMLSIELRKYRVECNDLVEGATKSKYPLQQAEGHIFWAQFAALECGAMAASEGDSFRNREALKREAVLHLDQAQEICQKYPGQTNSVSADVEGVRKMLDKSISSAKMRMVVAAMSKEFSLTGHWYCCVNGHPFTIGECGGAMEQTRCPECDAPIGGQHHQTAAGVTRAQHIERQFGNLHVGE
ncbi:hypothetical protein CKM354_000175600 [Cercospora kikuchii]|uniref:NFX1-type zinc finger-containing protein 1 n=1 Tax=Cercospora kikuchii TaxID=84275 RepID=A0A9P3C8V1_9PEZI|nr:uncharacterized protein CKM354_000175600 [Cercospora kikuchii]GIZ38336.1 hypothetical protein CKM354_000175600 [Cercospora kikuchii]